VKNHRLCTTLLLLALTFLPTPSRAGGPLSYWVDPVNGSDSNPGTEAAPFKTIAFAWTVAQANNLANQATTVNLNAGTYRESVTMNSEAGATSALITFQPASGASGKVIWSGAKVYTGWTVYSGNSNIYTHSWTKNYPVCAPISGCSSYLQEDIMLHREMVAVNGNVLTQVLSLGQMLYPGTFYADNASSTIYVWPPSGTNMATATVDIPEHSSVLSVNGVSNVVFSGIIFQYSNSCRSNAAVTVNGASSFITFDSDTFQWNNAQGIAIFNPATNITVENSVSNYNGDSGFQSSQTVSNQWINNIVEENNWRGAQAGYYGCNVAGQHVWLAHGDTLTNDTIAWNQTYGIHWDTDNRNITATGLMVADNLVSGVVIETNEGPISLSDSYICNQTSNLSGGGLVLRNSGYDSNFNATTPGVSLTNSFLYNNYSGEIVLTGQAGGIAISDWQTGKAYNLITGNYTNTGNTIQGVGIGQQVFGDFSLDGSDWTDFYTTLISNNNDWWNADTSSAAFDVPVPALGTSIDFPTWQADTGQDLTGSTFSAPSGDPFATCNAVTAPASDYWLTVDNNSLTVDPTSTAVFNLTVTSLAGFSGTVNLSLDGITEVKGLAATFSQNPITGGAGTSVLTITSTDGSTPAGTYSVTVIANSGNLTRTVTVQVVVPGASLLYSAVSLAFPATSVGTTSSALTVTITNKGTKSVKFTSYTIDTSVFAISANTCPASSHSLGVGKSCTISVTFTPSSGTGFTGTLTIVDGDVNSPQVVNLSGIGTANPGVMLSATNLLFGDVLENTASTMQLTLTNIGNANLTISNTTITGANSSMFTQTNNCPSPVLPDASCTFNVTFTPTNTMPDSATLTIFDNAAPSSQMVLLNGTGAIPRMSFTPNVMAFGSVAVGDSSVLTDTVTNSGAVPLTITKIALTGSDTTSYKESDNCPRSPSTLAAGATCLATITFSPTVSGALNSALTVTDNTSAGSNILNLTGAGKYPAASFNPTKLAFGDVAPNTSSVMTDTVTNTGSVALTITKIELTGSNTTYYKESDNCPRSPSTLASGATCVLTVTFTPTTTGGLNSTLTITDNTSAGTNNLSLTGTGKYPTLSFTPTKLAFGDVGLNSSSTLTDTVTNNGAVPLTITQIALTGANTTYYKESDNCPRSPSTLAAGLTCVVTVTFSPTISGGLNSTLTVTDNTSSGSNNLSLTGTGKYPTLSFTPTTLAFGDVGLSSSSTLTDTITNTGAVPLTITKIALTGSNTTYYKESDNCPRSPSALAAGATCVATVTFTPTISGGLNSTLTVTDNTSSGSNNLSLTGTGKYPTVSFTPPSLAFGSVPKNTSASLTDTITNTGDVPLIIAHIKFTGSNTKYYSKTDNCPRSPKTLAGGSTCTVTVTFTPTITGTLNSTLTLTDNTSAGTNNLNLTGKGE
jgi:hypothetical protein